MEQKFTHWKRFCNPDYLGAYSLDPDKDIVATIDVVTRENVMGEGGRQEECTVARFKERDIKPMVLNKTNCKTITKVYGTPFIENWAGKPIQIYATTTKLKGEQVECLRIRPQAPKLTKPELKPGHERWEEALKRLCQGDTTIDGIRKSYFLSDENAQIIREAAKNA